MLTNRYTMDKLAVCLLICCVTTVISVRSYYQCSVEETLRVFQKPVLEFSIRLLDKVSQETDDHFVFSPISTWLRVLALIEGASAETRTGQELFHIARLTGKAKRVCYRRTFRNIFNSIQYNVANLESERGGLIMVDRKFSLKKGFKAEVETLADNAVLSLNFNDPESAAQKAIDVMNTKIFNELQNIYATDFEQEGILITDIVNFKSAWKFPFDETKTLAKYFRTELKDVKIDMMQQTNNFKYFDYLIPPFKTRNVNIRNLKILELPCLDERLSMIILLPDVVEDISELFYALEDNNLSGLLAQLKRQREQLVKVSLPKFTTSTEVSNLVELLSDMGHKNSLDKAEEYNRLTDKRIAVKLMSQLAYIEVKEKHDLDLNDPFDVEGAAMEFTADHPFGYMLVHRETNIVLFAGVYSNPENID